MNPALGSQVEVMIGGRSITFSRFTRKILRAFFDWAVSVLPNPLDEARKQIKDFPIDIQKMIVADALERSKNLRTLNNPDVQALIQTPEGSMKIIELLVREKHPHFTSQEVEDLYEQGLVEYGSHYFPKIFSMATGTMSVDEEKVIKEELIKMGVLEGNTFRPVSPATS